MVRIIGVGDNTVDKYLDLGMMFPGGNAVNVPVLAHRYGHPAGYIGWLGDDAYGRLVLSALRQEGIAISRCRVVDGPNSYSEVRLVGGERIFGDSISGACEQIALTDEDLEHISRHDLAHTSIYSHIERYLPRLSEAARCLSFDFSQEWDDKYLAATLPWVDIALLSFPKCSAMEIRELVRWVHALGPACVLVTQGQQGAAAYDGRRVVRQDIVETEVVDTLGAGDAFAARFLVEYLSGVPIEAALEAAAKSAAETCGYYGAFGYGVSL